MVIGPNLGLEPLILYKPGFESFLAQLIFLFLLVGLVRPLGFILQFVKKPPGSTGSLWSSSRTVHMD